MTITLKDLKNLETAADLKLKNSNRPKEKIIEQKRSISLIENLFTLSSKLRSTGYLKQADSLEASIGMYKKAEAQDTNLLYSAQPDSKILESAHPDGDVELCDAEDDLGVVETKESQHEKILKAINAKDEVVKMLKMSLNIKTAQGRSFSEDSEESPEKRQNGFEEFKKIVEEIFVEIPRLVDPLNIDKYKNISLSNKKIVSDYLSKIDKLLNGTRKAVSIYGGYVSSNVKREKLDACRWPDALLKEIISFAKDIHDDFARGILTEVKDKNKVGFDNKEYSAHILSIVEGIQHRWYSFWGVYGGGTELDTKYHSKFLTPAMILSIFNPLKIKTNSIKELINEFILKNSKVTASPKISEYLNKLVNRIDSINSELDKVTTEISKFSDKSEFFGSRKLTVDIIKNSLSDPALVNLNFSSLDLFSSGLTSLYKTIVGKLLQLVNTNTVFDDNREQVVHDINLRLATLG